MKDKKVSWMWDNINETTWDKNKFIKGLGNCVELKVSNRNPKIIKAYYFQDVDMTIYVSKPKMEVLAWREGKTDTF